MKRLPVIIILLSFFLNTLGPMPAGAVELVLPKPGVMVHLSPSENPPVLKGVTVYPNDPFKFDFILDKGDSQSASVIESAKLVKYFLASITTPENDLWVNLSPYEKNRIIPDSFGQTDMGRDLLAEDYILKQITASLIYPEGAIGKQFWKRIYEEAVKEFGTTDIPVNTFNKVWIVPDHAKVYEHGNTAFVVKATLKVMLEQDYLSLQKQLPLTPSLTKERGNNEISPLFYKEGIKGSSKDINNLGSQIVRQIVIPELEKEVNEGQNFAILRQVYYSLILAVWFKKRMKDSILGRKYVDQNKVMGIHYDHSVIASEAKQSFSTVISANVVLTDTEAIYQRYLKAFKKGVYNYIKEEPDPVTREMTPRKYFSGGFVGDFAMHSFEETHEILSEEIPRSTQVTGIEVNLSNGKSGQAMNIGGVSRKDSALLVTQPNPKVVDRLDEIQSELSERYYDLRVHPGQEPKFGPHIGDGTHGNIYNDPDPRKPKQFYKVFPFGREHGLPELTNLEALKGVEGVPQVLEWGVNKWGNVWAHMEGIENAQGIFIDSGGSVFKSVIWGGFNFSQKLEVFSKVAKILKAAHQSGISHNDVKPANIIINAQREVMVADWGFAKAIGEEMPLGTQTYKAPEIIKQDQSDVYSLGQTIFNVFSSELLQNTKTARDLKELYDNMILHNANDRLSMENVADKLGNFALEAATISGTGSGNMDQAMGSSILNKMGGSIKTVMVRFLPNTLAKLILGDSIALNNEIIPVSQRVETLISQITTPQVPKRPTKKPIKPKNYLVINHDDPRTWNAFDHVIDRESGSSFFIKAKTKKIERGQLVPKFGIGDKLYTYDKAIQKFKWVPSAPSSDQAMNAANIAQKKSGPGGIDLTANRMKLDIDSDKAAVGQPMNLKALENIEIKGLYIKDIEIKPLKNLPEILGVSPG